MSAARRGGFAVASRGRMRNAAREFDHRLGRIAERLEHWTVFPHGKQYDRLASIRKQRIHPSPVHLAIGWTAQMTGLSPEMAAPKAVSHPFLTYFPKNR